MQPHKLALEPLTFADLAGRALLELAHAAGFEYASLNLLLMRSGAYDPLVSDSGLRRETVAWLRETGLGVQTVEVFNLTPDSDPRTYGPVIEAAQELGAHTATCVLFENSDKAGAAVKFRELCRMAEGTRIRVNLEFFKACKSITTLQDALDFLDLAGCPEAGLVIDTLHVMRTAGSFDILDSLDPALVGSAQINDGPLDYPGDKLFEAGADRLVPGEGAFNLRQFVGWLPRDIALGVEVPSPQRAVLGDDIAFARRLRAAALAVYG